MNAPYLMNAQVVLFLSKFQLFFQLEQSFWLICLHNSEFNIFLYCEVLFGIEF